MFWIAVAIIVVGFLWYSMKANEQARIDGAELGSLSARASRIEELRRQGQALGASDDAEGIVAVLRRQLSRGETDDAAIVLDGYWRARKLSSQSDVVGEVGLMLGRGDVNHMLLSLASMFGHVIALETAAAEEVLAARIGIRYSDDRRPPSVDTVGALVAERVALPLDQLVEDARESTFGLISKLAELARTLGPDAEGPSLHRAFAEASDAAVEVAVECSSLARWIADHHPGEVVKDASESDSEIERILRRRTKISSLS